jgi:2,3-dihydroxybiphenyl 1,2-dioxygenase
MSSTSVTQPGETRLGYAVVESRRLDAWRTFAEQGLGLHVDVLDGGALGIRLDDRQRRLVVRPGDAEDIVALGWDYDDEASLAAMLARLQDQQVACEAGAPDEAELRGVRAFHRFQGPKGLALEIHASPRMTNQPLGVRGAGFVTGSGGMGHVALTTRKPEAVIAQFQTLFGARLTDNITDRIMGLEMEFTFLHMNERHHSVAVAATKGVRLDPIRKRVQHLMVEAQALDDVSDAYVRCRELGFRIAMGVGQHPNDRQVSFYVVTPSGFEMELGWNPIVISDEAAWTPRTYRGISKWGHQPDKLGVGDKLKMLGGALASAWRRA